MNLLNLTLHFNGFPIKKAKTELSFLKQLSFLEKEAHIEQKKWGVFNYHLQHNSFYKSFTKNKTYKKWGDIPVMTKSDLQQPLQKRLSEGFKNSTIYSNKTSGSSGHPFIFAKDKFSHAITWAIYSNWYGWFDIYNKKQARFYGLPKERSKCLKERIKDFFSNRYRFDVFDLSDIALDSWITIFSKNKFVFITGYTTVIVAFARHLVARNIVLSRICPTLKVCLPTSEMCSETDKQLMGKAFGVPIKNEYGAAEFGLIALEHHRKWVLNDLNLYVEILDDNNNAIPYGKEGRIIITDLYNKAHPFIRYDIGDVGAINMIDNTLVLERLVGRKEDYIQLPSGKTAPGLAFYYVTKSVMQDDGNVKEIKVIQTAIDTFEIQYIANSKLNEHQKEQMQIALNQYLEPNIVLNFKHLTILERTKRGKLKQFTSLIN